MNHKFFEGTILHKRLLPKEHDFKYNFFMLDIDLKDFKSLENRYFSINKFNLFSFFTKDHFGQSEDFLKNVQTILKVFNINPSSKMRFITLPRILGYVFNPISILIIFEENRPSYLLAEVHNYNGGRVIYPIKLETNDNLHFKGESKKDMYVSPFFKRDGEYKFALTYDDSTFSLNVILYEDKEKKLISTFSGEKVKFCKKNIKRLFFKHTLLTIFVVTRTIWQSFKLKRKGLLWNSPTPNDQIRRY